MESDARYAVNVNVRRAIEVLNDALSRDRAAVEAVILHRVVCNRELAEHPTIVVGDESGGDGKAFSLGALGLINGIFGVDEEGWGHIAVLMDQASGRILRFVLTKDDA